MESMHLQLIFSLLLFLFYLSSCSCAGDVEVMCREKEKQALLKFKEGLVDYANELSSWGGSEENCCNWKRVQCDETSGHVSVLDLRPIIRNEYGGLMYTAFKGEIGSSLVELQNLTYLDLSRFEGSEISIPKFIGSLANLRYLNLSSSDFIGTIPEELGNLSRLVTLDLSNNKFENVESVGFLSDLRALEHLEMSDNNLSLTTDWFQAISLLPSLVNFRMSNCELSLTILPPLPSSTKSPRSLEVIDLSSNSVTSLIFPGLFSPNNSFPAIKQINLACNLLEGAIPITLANFPSLEILDLSESDLSGEIPDMKNSLSIREIYLSGNKLNGSLYSSIGLLSNLEILDISSNSLDGQISELHFLNLTKLQYLDISSNSFIVDFSRAWVPPFQLVTLKMSSCKLGPQFPQWLQLQNKISHLDISNAGISDVISDWFWDLPLKLEYFNISSNQISGNLDKLSTILGSFPVVDLASNRFNGSIPILPSTTTILDISKNMFSGSITNLCSVAGNKLNFLDLSDNFLSGELPDCWMNWERLEIINLASNSFSGTFPPSFGQLRLKTLQLRNNRFSGEFPPSVANFTAIQLLDLGENSFSGKMPAWVGENLSDLVILRLRSNHFYGDIPRNLCNLDYLQILDLSRNNFSGKIPECVSNFTAIASERSSDLNFETLNDPVEHSWGTEWKFGKNYVAKVLVVWKGIELEYGKTLSLVKSIDLSSNNLTGQIPEDITSLLGLISLNLSHNQLTGMIPQQIGQLTLLESFDLSTNQLSGKLPKGLADLHFLSRLNLSDNNFSGKIPRSTQLQSFDRTSFEENAGLCGEPLPNRCPGEEVNTESDKGSNNVDTENSKDELITTGYYISMGIGFATGFWVVCGSLLLHRPWRITYFRFLDRTGSSLRGKTKSR